MIPTPPSGPSGTIELRLREMSQLFNSMDPAPFHEKDLDHDAEEFILSWAREFRAREPLSLKIYLETPAPSGSADVIRRAVRNYFGYRAEMSRRDLRHLLRQARTSLFIGLAFLAICLFVTRMLSGRPWSPFFEEGFTIAGWVALWRPIQVYLYDWWPISDEIRTHSRLASMPVEIVEGRAG